MLQSLSSDYDTSTESMAEHLEELFATHGKPMIIKTDNGPEFRLNYRNDLKNLGVHLLNNPGITASPTATIHFMVKCTSSIFMNQPHSV